MSADADKLMRGILMQTLSVKDGDYRNLVAYIKVVAGEENLALVLKELAELEKDSQK